MFAVLIQSVQLIVYTAHIAFNMLLVHRGVKEPGIRPAGLSPDKSSEKV
jgi:hypothetical protein